MFLVAINAIDRGRSANPRVIEPGHIFSIEVDKTFQNLIDIQAMREATEEECKIAEGLGRLHYDGADDESAAVPVVAEALGRLHDDGADDKSAAVPVVADADTKKAAGKKPAEPAVAATSLV